MKRVTPVGAATAQNAGPPAAPSGAQLPQINVQAPKRDIVAALALPPVRSAVGHKLPSIWGGGLAAQRYYGFHKNRSVLSFWCERLTDLGCFTMGHLVTGLIARPTVLEAFSREHSLHGPVALAGDLAILPLREADLGRLGCVPSDEETEGFQHLSKQLIDQLRRSSHEGTLMYFETEYFAGEGGQGAAVFQDGDLIFGPHWAEVGPINQALKLLGTSCEPPSRDEFEAVGLHLHRDAEGWLKQR